MNTIFFLKFTQIFESITVTCTQWLENVIGTVLITYTFSFETIGSSFTYNLFTLILLIKVIKGKICRIVLLFLSTHHMDLYGQSEFLFEVGMSSFAAHIRFRKSLRLNHRQELPHEHTPLDISILVDRFHN